MKSYLKNIKLIFVLGFLIFSFTKCATIVGGNMYVAHVNVVDHPKAEIYYKDNLIGKGRAKLYVMRRSANKLNFTIVENGCDTLKVNYVSRTFRGGAFAGTLFGWTGIYQGIILPWGVAVDFATGSLYKPNVNEKGITKINYKHFNYDINYKGCPLK